MSTRPMYISAYTKPRCQAPALVDLHVIVLGSVAPTWFEGAEKEAH